MSKSYYQDMAKLILSRETPEPIVINTQPKPNLFKKTSRFKRFKNWLYIKFYKKKIIKEIQDCDSPVVPTNTITAYSGADLIITIGPKFIAEAQGIRWYKPSDMFVKELANSDYYDKDLAMKYPVVVLIDLAVFQTEPLNNLKSKFGSDIVMTYANEYGASSYRTIRDVTELFSISGTTIDTVINEKYMVACASRITDLKESN